MKTILAAALLTLIIGNIGAVDTESYQFIDYLLGLPGAGAPALYEDGVIFTAPSSLQRVGISFAHEGFAKVYWFQKLMIPQDPALIKNPKKQNSADLYRDSGILFYVYTLPENMKYLEYRLIIDGLWTTDPLNPLHRMNPSGLAFSMVLIPEVQKVPSTFDAPPGSLNFFYNAPSGEIITVGGSFNGWDPFMYELRETSPGTYSLTLPLPPGIYYYVFFHRGQRLVDPHNKHKVYTKDRKIASEAVVR
jgi:hypothetical protein